MPTATDIESAFQGATAIHPDDVAAAFSGATPVHPDDVAKAFQEAPHTGSGRDFYAKVYQYAKNLGDAHPDVVAAQAMLESAGGTRPSGANNFFGIKGPGSSVDTHEFVNGRMQPQKASFKDYSNLEDSVVDRVRLASKGRYAQAGYGTAKDADGAIDALVKAGYATDPQYGHSLRKIIGEYGGSRSQPPAAPQPVPTISPVADPMSPADRAKMNIRNAHAAQKAAKVNPDRIPTPAQAAFQGVGQGLGELGAGLINSAADAIRPFSQQEATQIAAGNLTEKQVKQDVVNSGKAIASNTIPFAGTAIQAHDTGTTMRKIYEGNPWQLGGDIGGTFLLGHGLAPSIKAIPHAIDRVVMPVDPAIVADRMNATAQPTGKQTSATVVPRPADPAPTVPPVKPVGNLRAPFTPTVPIFESAQANAVRPTRPVVQTQGEPLPYSPPEGAPQTPRGIRNPFAKPSETIDMGGMPPVATKVTQDMADAAQPGAIRDAASLQSALTAAAPHVDAIEHANTAQVFDALADTATKRYPQIYPTKQSYYAQHIADVQNSEPSATAPIAHESDTLNSALGYGLQKTNGFGSVKLSDGSIHPINLIARGVSNGDVLLADGNHVDANVILSVIDRDGKTIWEKPNINAPIHETKPSSQPTSKPVTEPPKATQVEQPAPADKPLSKYAQEWLDENPDKSAKDFHAQADYYDARAKATGDDRYIRHAAENREVAEYLDRRESANTPKPPVPRNVQVTVGGTTHKATTPPAIMSSAHMADPNLIDTRETGQDPARIERAKGLYKTPEDVEYSPPITSVVDTDGTRTVIDGHHRVFAAREMGTPIRTVDIPRSLYDHLKSKDFDDIEISHAMLTNAEEHDAADGLHYQFGGSDIRGRGAKALDAIDEWNKNHASIPIKATDVSAHPDDVSASDTLYQHYTPGSGTDIVSRKADALHGAAEGMGYDVTHEDSAYGSHYLNLTHPNTDPIQVRVADHYSNPSNGSSDYYVNTEHPHSLHQTVKAIADRVGSKPPAWVTREAAKYNAPIAKKAATDLADRQSRFDALPDAQKQSVANLEKGDPNTSYTSLDNDNGNAYHVKPGVGNNPKEVYKVTPEGEVSKFAGGVGRSSQVRISTDGKPGLGDTLFQGPKGSVTFRPEDGKAIIRLFKSADASTALHEIGHILVRTLRDEDLAAVEKWNGGKLGDWTTKQHEKFARAWERYIHDGVFPTIPVKHALDVMKDALRRIYGAIAKGSIKGEVSPELKAVFDRVLGKTEEANPATTKEASVSSNNPKSPVPSKEGKIGPIDTEKYAGSINTRLLGMDADAIKEVRSTAEQLGMTNKEKVTDEQSRALGKSLNLSYNDMEKMRPGVFPAPPPDVRPAVWSKAYADAVRNLHAHAKVDLVDARRATSEAQDEHADNPTAKTQADIDAANIEEAKAQRVSDMMQKHDDEAANVAGVTLQGRNTVSEPVKGEGYQNALAEAPTVGEALGWKSTAREGRPMRVRSVTPDDANAAIARLKARKGPLVLKQEEVPDNVFFQHAEPDDATKDLVTLGTFHYEGGARDFGKWRSAMEDPQSGIGVKMSEGDAQYVYRLTKSDIAKDVSSKQIKALKPLFVDQLGRELGSKGAAQFLTDLPANLRNRLIEGQGAGAFSDAEKAEIAKHWDANQPVRKKPATSSSATTAKQIANDLKPKRAFKKVGPALDFDTAVAHRVTGGKVAATAIRANLESDALGKSALDKASKGEPLSDDEGRRLARAIDAFKRTPSKSNPSAITQRVTQVITDARKGRLGYDSPKEAAKAQMFREANAPMDRLGKNATDEQKAKVQEKVDARVKAISRDLDVVGDHDGEAIAKVIMKHSTLSDQFGQYILGNILSGPDTAVKVGVAHPATVGMEDVRRYFSGGSKEVLGGINAGLKAMRKQGLQEAKAIMTKGSTAAHLEGKSYYKTNDGRIPVESKLAPWKYLLRTHSAYYHMLQVYNAERGLHMYATEDGVSKGLSGADLADHVTDVQLHPERYRPIVEKAIKFGAEETQTNKNAIAQAISHGASRFDAKFGGHVATTAKNILLPVANLPLNAVGRTIESGTGLVTHKALAAAYEKLHPDATPEEVEAYRKKVIGRGAVGAAVAGVGAAVNLLGGSDAPDTKHGRYVGRVHVPGTNKAADVPAGNFGAMMDTGSTLVRDLKNGEPLAIPGDIGEIYANENPLLRSLDTASGIVDILTGKAKARDMAKTAGGLATEVMPMSGATRNIASYIDVATGKGVRAKATTLDYVKNIEPGLRQQLPLTKNKNNGDKPYGQSALHFITRESKDEEVRNDRETKRAYDKDHK